MNLKYELKALGVIERGDFKLRNGSSSNIFFNIKKAYGYPKLLEKIVEELSGLFNKDVNCVAASGYGGIPLAVAISQKYNLHLTMVRSELKDHGNLGLIEGYIPTKQDNVAIVDDVFTIGSSLSGTIKPIKEITNIEGCYVVFKRTKNNFSYKLRYLFSYKDF